MGILKKAFKFSNKGHKKVAKKALKIKKKLPGLRKGVKFAAKTSASARIIRKGVKRR